MSKKVDLSHLPESIQGCTQAILDQIPDLSTHKHQAIVELLGLLQEESSPADLKLLSRTISEIRTGLNVFRPYQAVRKVSVFGSARIASDHPRYIQTRDCAKRLTEEGFMVITGGGPGLMQAANEGADIEHSFGININLPMEQDPNPIVAHSPRHFYCQYFFTRKLFFLKESDAVVLTPGGFGTLDEAFETLTLLQNGRNAPMPVVMLEAPGDDYWAPFVNSWMRRLVEDDLISNDDQHMILHTDNIDAATRHIADFYLNYHSCRYVSNKVLIRMLNPLHEDSLERLNAEFSDVLEEGRIEQVWHWPKNDDPGCDHLPRLVMHMNRRRINVLPVMIQRINSLFLLDQAHMR